MKDRRGTPFTMLALGVVLLMALVLPLGCAAPAAPQSGSAPQPAATSAPAAPAAQAPAAPAATKAPAAATTAAASSKDFDLDALIKAAQKEGELVAYFTSSRIKNAGDNFEKAYGIKVKGTKMGDSESAERVIREVDSKNVQVDVIGFEDSALLATKLIPNGYVTSWLPPDMASEIPASDHNPLTYLWQPRMIGYNTEANPNGCPIKNIWELTEAKWKGKFIVRDPALTPANLAWFASLAKDPAALEKAYKDFYGKALDTKEKNAGYEFLKRLFQNGVVVVKGDGDVGDAVGAAGQKDPPIGMYTLTKHRDNKEKNLKLATCRGMQPFMGYALPTYTLLVNNSPHPNAAKLFVHYLLTPEGIAPWTKDDMGAFSPNPKAAVNPDNEGTWAEWLPQLSRIDVNAAVELRQQILDMWLQYGASAK